MVDYDVHWMGLLCNVDSSILGLKLPQGFEIKFFTEEEAIQHLMEVGKISEYRDATKFYWDYPCVNTDEGRLYYITRTETLDLDLTEDGRLKALIVGETEGLYNKFIRKIVRLLRLYKDGDIRIPMDYRYFEYKGKLRSNVTRHTSVHVSRVKFHLSENDIDELNAFFNIQLPLTPPFLELAFKNYERSYESQNQVLAFLSLMISLEILYNLGGGEIGYRIARNCAVLLGNSKNESDAIFKDIRKIYKIRSKIVHSGDISKCDEELVKIVRHYIRESIKKMIQLGEDKEKILSKINTLGFGEINSYVHVEI